MSATTRSEAGSDCPAPTSPVLKLESVVKEYGGKPPVRALDRVNLNIGHGELVAIVGPSGSGKSTMMNIIGTLDRPTSGDVLIEGSSTRAMSDARLAGLRSGKIGFVFQQFHLLSGLSAQENVASGLLYRGVRPKDRRRRSARALERVGLGHRMGHRPGELSGGERQRVAIARALVGDPAIVVADEPTGNLDSRTSDEIVDLMLELHAEGSTIVVITHDTTLAERLPRRIKVLDGRIDSDDQGSGLSKTEAVLEGHS